MQVYVYNADIYCADCGRAMIKQAAKGQRERDARGRFLPIDYDTGPCDSNDFPAGPYGDGGGEADCPQHCGSGADCLNALKLSDRSKVGAWLENPLTTDGLEYVRQAVAAGGEVAGLWTQWYADELE